MKIFNNQEEPAGMYSNKVGKLRYGWDVGEGVINTGKGQPVSE